MALRNSFVQLVACMLALGLASNPAPAQDKQKLPEVSKKDLTSKVPNFFYFESDGDPDSKRLWLRVDNKLFIERYPNGMESKFKMMGRAKVDGIHGTVLAKVGGSEEEAGTPNDGSFQVFLPDRGSAKMEFRFRNTSNGDDWATLTEMKKVE